MSDRELSAMLRAPAMLIHVLQPCRDGRGFHELDRSGWPVMNLNYFGLLPHAVGRGLGDPFLRHAVDAAFGLGAKALTVNTCTADHPRALPTYLRAGFQPLRSVPRRSGRCRNGWGCAYRRNCGSPAHAAVELSPESPGPAAPHRS